jgi:hypothetical protein
MPLEMTVPFCHYLITNIGVKWDKGPPVLRLYVTRRRVSWTIYFWNQYLLMMFAIQWHRWSPAQTAWRGGPVGQGGPADVQNTKTCCRLFRIEFRSSDRRQFLRDLAVILLMIVGWPPIIIESRSEGDRPVIYAAVAIPPLWTVGLPVTTKCHL